MTSSCKKNKKKIASVSKKEKEKKEFVQLSDIPAVDEYCSGCKKPGNLVVCDVMKCKKGYHLECIENPPKNIRFSMWVCPEHFCCICKCKEIVHECSFCTNAYCQAHVENNVFVKTGVVPFQYVCSNHLGK